MKDVNIGIIGAGFMGKTHSEAIARYTKNAKLVAITGGPKEFYKQAKELADKYNVDCEDSIESMLKRTDIDAVMLDTPNHTHAEQTIPAAEHGKHVFVELPIAVRLKDCDAMIRACKKAGVNLMVGQHQRYRKGNSIAKKAIDEGKIGDVFMIRDTMTGNRMGAMPGWLKDPANRNLGILVGPGTHCIDRVNWFIDGWDKVESVFASCGTFREDVPIEASAMVLVKYKHGVTATFWVSFEAPPPGALPYTGFVCQVMGTKGLLDVNPYGKSRQTKLGTGDKWESLYVTPQIHMDKTHDAFLHKFRILAYAECVQEFVNSILEERTPAIPGEQDRYNVEIALAAYKSSKLGKAVQLPLKPDDKFYNLTKNPFKT